MLYLARVIPQKDRFGVRRLVLERLVFLSDIVSSGIGPKMISLRRPLRDTQAKTALTNGYI